MNFLGMLLGVALFGVSAFREFGKKKEAGASTAAAPKENKKSFAPASPAPDDSEAAIKALEKEMAEKK